MKTTIHNLIFSDNSGTKIKRHLMFWFGWFMYISCTQLRNQTPEEIGLRNFVIYQLGVSLNRVLLQIIIIYPFIYIIIPRFLQKNKLISFYILIIVFLSLMYLITLIDYLYIWSDIHSPIYFDIPNVKPLSRFQSEYFALYSNIHCTGTLVSASILLAVKYYKNWYQKERENESLIFQHTQAELQLLKAQVHPHFLFNTLNNIYSLMLDDSPKAVTVLNELSGMMLYMLKEGMNPVVSIEKEIKMLMDYIGLEKIRYGERLTMFLDIRLNSENDLLIAPLLMIPFVENSFKHGASKTMNKAEIHLSIITGNDWIKFSIRNNICVPDESGETRIKIGVDNVKKRLQILYPGKYNLDIQSGDGIFLVTMKITLEKQIKLCEEVCTSTFQKFTAYAK